MKTTICLACDVIKVVKYDTEKDFIVVESAQSHVLKEGCVINGVITNYDEVLTSLVEIKNSLNINKCHLVIDSSLVMVKKLDVPVLSNDRVVSFVKNSFSPATASGEEYIYDFSTLGSSSKNGMTILGIAVKKSVVEQFMRLFNDAKIKLLGIDVGINSLMKVANFALKDKENYIFSYLEGDVLISILFIKKVFYFSMRTRILSDLGSESFISEVIRTISSIIQFKLSQKVGGDLDCVYLGGLNNDDFESCEQKSKLLGLPFIDVSKVINFKSEVNVANYLLTMSEIKRKW